MRVSRHVLSLIFAALLSGLVLAEPGIANAAIPPKAQGAAGGYSITLYTMRTANAPGNPGSEKVVHNTQGKRVYPVMVPTVTTNSRIFANTPCIAFFFEYYSTQEQASAANFAPQLLYILNRHYPMCRYRYVAPPPRAVTPRPVLSQQMIRSTISRRLPSPSPAMDPGFGVVGLSAYLSANARLANQLDASLAAGRVSATAGGTIRVDWGDGSADLGPTRAEGGPWPSGDLKHTYRKPGCYRITVTVNWQVSYDAGGHSGSLSGIQTQGEIPNYCVYQVSSVMLR